MIRKYENYISNISLLSISYGAIFFMIHILHVSYKFCGNCSYLLDIKLILTLSFIANAVIFMLLIKTSSDGVLINKKVSAPSTPSILCLPNLRSLSPKSFGV